MGTLPDESIDYYTQTSILVVNSKGDTLIARYDPDHTSDLIVYKVKHPKSKNQKVYVLCYINNNEIWIQSAGWSSSVMTIK